MVASKARHSIVLLLGGAALFLPATSAFASDLDVAVEGLRNQRGTLRLCLTRNPAFFPDCKSDPHAVRRSAPVASGHHIHLTGIAAGRYALSVMHDENDNGRLDRMMMIPKEGFGFSRNPKIRMGPPRFEETLFEVGAGRADQTVRVRYLL